jgi:hypothetical protein
MATQIAESISTIDAYKNQTWSWNLDIPTIDVNISDQVAMAQHVVFFIEPTTAVERDFIIDALTSKAAELTSRYAALE